MSNDFDSVCFGNEQDTFPYREYGSFYKSLKSKKKKEITLTEEEKEAIENSISDHLRAIDETIKKGPQYRNKPSIRSAMRSRIKPFTGW